jgi:anti-sigma factor RsiW
MTATAELTCRELVELVTDYLEDALSPERRELFEEHVAACEACGAYVEQMRETRRALGTLSEGSIPPDARAALLHAFRGWRGQPG